MNAYQQMAKGKLLVKQGTELIKDAQPKVTGFVQQSKDGQVENDFGRFQLVTQPKYEYSKTVKELETKLKDLKAQEVENGTATPIPSTILRYYFPKK